MRANCIINLVLITLSCVQSVKGDGESDLIVALRKAHNLHLADKWSGGVSLNGEKTWIELYRLGKQIKLRSRETPLVVHRANKDDKSGSDPITPVSSEFFLEAKNGVWLLEIRLDGMVIGRKSESLVFVSQTNEDLRFRVIPSSNLATEALVCEDLARELRSLIEEQMNKSLEPPKSEK